MYSTVHTAEVDFLKVPLTRLIFLLFCSIVSSTFTYKALKLQRFSQNYQIGSKKSQASPSPSRFHLRKYGGILGFYQSIT
ncbi:hypothetical protein ONS95_009129 [Cadophora gregata]|uniref:uncharacterized protein n=1 Tax=Cadophora gregata TaxID=51156 RepID=UPI0026DD648F|nr:uncharacterized protein ONS95_009129 [Cadophora gregata]KAK0124146.1 hypothetical protein ONS95_009129 [Cadophora gregata]KAK0130476.1 hypothetical protein ONS96_000995 [Cadophora gregata f. sp. sojae]